MNGLHEQWRGKVVPDRRALAEKLSPMRAERTLVFTNGCFDLLHPGHVDYLCRARDLGDMLVVGLNSDDSVRRLKGPRRPVRKWADRAAVLAGLSCVDFVTGFDEDTPVETLRLLRPDIHTKGGDYKLEELPEREAVEAGGGRIVLLPFLEGHSTTATLNRLAEEGDHA